MVCGRRFLQWEGCFTSHYGASQETADAGSPAFGPAVRRVYRIGSHGAQKKVLCIDTPTGQVSFHLMPYEGAGYP